MTTDEKLIVVLEWMGWKPFKVKIDDEWSYDDGEYKTYWKDSLGYEHRELPPLTLDWIHEAEKKLFPTEVSQLYEPDKWEEYTARLDILCIGHPGGKTRATAEQRLDALVKTIQNVN